MHFCVSAARVSLLGIAPAHLLTSAAFCPRKIGTNWFIPAFVKSRFGESGISDDDGTIVCFFSRKKSRKAWRIWALVIMAGGRYRGVPRQNTRKCKPRAGESAQCSVLSTQC